MNVFSKNNVKISGRGKKAMIFAHGYGCDQNVWRFMTPAFEDEYQLVLFDHVGAGRSDLSAYSRTRYGTLQGYADDVLDIYRALSLRETILVGHSVSAMIGALAAIKEPDRFEKLVLVAPSPASSTTGITPAASPGRTSRSCSTPSTATTWAGRARWRP
jgi:sigma-B regulation protein RsbQ